MVLADALRNRLDDHDFVYDAILGLANLVTLDENAAAFRHDEKRLDALGDVLEAHGDDEDIATFALKALVRLAADDGISKAITELVLLTVGLLRSSLRWCTRSMNACTAPAN